MFFHHEELEEHKEIIKAFLLIFVPSRPSWFNFWRAGAYLAVNRVQMPIPIKPIPETTFIVLAETNLSSSEPIITAKKWRESMHMRLPPGYPSGLSPCYWRTVEWRFAFYPPSLRET